jgi:CSLREA domain-containing protein
MISKNSLRNLVARALASAFRRTDKRLKRRNSRTEQLETRALLAVFTVTSTADIAAAGTLRHAIDQANSTPGDDEIRFDVATIGTEFDLGGTQFTITESLTITGNGPDNTVIDAQLNSRIFEIAFSAVNVTIFGVTLKNGRVTGPGLQVGGAIQSLASGTLSISSSVLSTNTVDDTTGTDAYGGAVFVQVGNLTVFDSTMTGNTADWGGAIYAAGDSHVAITSSNVDGNIASNDGGAIYAGFGGQGDVTITSSTLENNQSQRRGGAIKADNVTIIGGSSVRLNSATTEGGAIHADGNVTVTNSRIEDNTATTHGGAIHAGGNVMVTGISTMSDNTANGDGGAIFSIGSTEVTNSTLANNSTTGDNHRGGAIHSDSGAVTISQSTLSGNSTAGSNAEGGAIFAHSGAVSISQSTLSGNSTAGSSADGGAIYADSGAVSISQSTLSGNSTAGGSAEGGAIYAYSGAVSISQSTLSGNSTAGTGAQGGAIYANNGAVSICQSTLTLNNAAQSLGGAIYSYSSPVTIRNSIVAGNTDNGTAPDVRKSPAVGDAFTVTNSLIGRNNGTGLTATGTTPGANGNLIGGDNAGAAINPLLAPLANNGGPTQTHALLATSPVINKGSNALAVDAANGSSPLTTDQRGNPFVRIFDTTVDMGAYEFFTGPLVVSTTIDESDGNFSSGDLSLREAIELANSSPETNSITFATSTNGTGFDLSLNEMFVTDTLTITGNGAANTVIDAQQASRIFNFSSGDFTLNGVTLKNGKTTADGNGGGGGAIAASSSGLLTVQNSTVSGNSTAGSTARGGAIFAISGAVTISQSTLSGNSTAGSDADGGAIYAISGAVTISQSTLSGNSTAGSNSDGGAIFAFSGAVSISHSTLSGNSTAGSDAYGGAIYAENGAVTISQSTLTLNNAQGQGGAIFSFSSSVTILNSIVAGNTDDGTAPDVRKSPDVGDAFIVTNSMIGRNNGTGLTASATPDSNGNLIGGNNSGAAINPQLAPLAYNGGPTQTHALLATSPAINKGSNALAVDVTQPDPKPALPTDQRGNPFARIFDTNVDMGAYERQTFAASFFVVTTTSDELNYSNGVVSLREAIISANGNPGSNTITFAPALFTGGPASIVLTLGELAITESVTINGPGQTQLSINANQLSRVLNVIGGSQINVTLSGLTLTGGRTTASNASSSDTTHSGGGIRFDSTGTLTLTNSTVSGNTTTGRSTDGGGIFTRSGAVTLMNSTVSENSTTGELADGGGIYSKSGGGDADQQHCLGKQQYGI